MEEPARTDIKHGSWLHDCGKIGVPEIILNKPGALDPHEMDIVKKHPVWGADVARLAHRPEPVLNIILYHHEKWDGTGYPTGKKAANIPLEARIVSVADIFDALTSHRPYRKAFAFQKALVILKGMRETALDPEILDVFLLILGTADIRGEADG